MSYTSNMNCPRCTNEMTCRPDDIAQCPCTDIAISDKLKTFLSKTSYDCLCNSCLKELESLLNKINEDEQHVSNKELVKGVHFYIDQGQYVFTEYYHIQRGSCCENQCRHCAYGLRLN